MAEVLQRTVDVLAISLAQVGIVEDDPSEQYSLDYLTARRLIAELEARGYRLEAADTWSRPVTGATRKAGSTGADHVSSQASKGGAPKHLPLRIEKLEAAIRKADEFLTGGSSFNDHRAPDPIAAHITLVEAFRGGAAMNEPRDPDIGPNGEGRPSMADEAAMDRASEGDAGPPQWLVELAESIGVGQPDDTLPGGPGRDSAWLLRRAVEKALQDFA